VRIAQRQHQLPALGVSPDEYEAVLRAALGLPSFIVQPFQRLSQSLSEVRAWLQVLALDEMPLEVIDDSTMTKFSHWLTKR
jgi:hypothetical protein